MRDIKLRAWDPQKNEMITEPEELHSNCFNETDNGFHCGYMDDDWVQCELMQFTGLRDKAREEIYEGDIIRLCDHYQGDIFYPSRLVVVVFNDGGYGTQHGGKYFCELWEALNVAYGRCIGNIYEDPELLK